MTPLSEAHQEALKRSAAGGSQADGARSFNINAATIGRLAPLRQGRFSMDYQEISCTRKDGGKFRDWWHTADDEAIVRSRLRKLGLNPQMSARLGRQRS